MNTITQIAANSKLAPVSIDLRREVFDPVAERVEARADSLVQTGRIAMKYRSGIGIEGWLKVEAVAALGGAVKQICNDGRIGCDLVCEFPGGRLDIELKGGLGQTPTSLPYVCEEDKRKKGTPTWADRGVCVFLGYGADRRIAVWRDGEPLEYSFKGVKRRVKLVAHKVFLDGEREWVIGLLAPVPEV